MSDDNNVTSIPKKADWLKRAGAGFARFIFGATHLAEVAEPIVDLALISSGQAAAATLYNEVVRLALMAEAYWGSDPEHSAKKAADVVEKLGPTVTAAFGGDPAQAKDYVDAVILSLKKVDLSALVAAKTPS